MHKVYISIVITPILKALDLFFFCGAQYGSIWNPSSESFRPVFFPPLPLTPPPSREWTCCSWPYLAQKTQ